MTNQLSDYRSFLASKRTVVKPSGFDVSFSQINPRLWDWQASVVQWALKIGRAALFEDCGLGKTVQQLEWARQVHLHTSRPVLILCPLAVAWQTRDEAERFGIDVPVEVVESREDVAEDAGICITNYEKLHLLDCSQFAGVVLDESSILKNFTGAIKRQLITEFRNTPYKLACTATPAPNDHKELGNHSEFLGVMNSNDMMSRWFINDSMKFGNYRLKRHGEADFWKWVSSWAVCLSNPADLGEQFRDDRYTLPELVIHEHLIEVPGKSRGQLFNTGDTVNATGVHKEKRVSLELRCKKMADLMVYSKEPWGLWCHTDYEANQILKTLGVKGDGKDLLGGVVEVRGSHSTAVKEERLRAFTTGQSRSILTKPSIGGYGLNWQHCCNTATFASFSYEDWYQLIRRFLRFGQESEYVNCHLIFSENEMSIVSTLKEKERQHREMQTAMAQQMAEFTQEQIYKRPALMKYEPRIETRVPGWLRSK